MYFSDDMALLQFQEGMFYYHLQVSSGHGLKKVKASSEEGWPPRAP